MKNQINKLLGLIVFYPNLAWMLIVMIKLYSLKIFKMILLNHYQKIPCIFLFIRNENLRSKSVTLGP